MSDIPTCPQFPARPPHGGEPFIVPPAPRRKPGLSVLSVNGRTPDGHGDLALTYIDGAEYAAGYGDPPRPALLFRQGGEVVAVVDATPLLKDGMVSSVAVSGGNLVVTFNTDAGREPVSVPLAEIFDPGAYYDKTAADALLSGKADKVADATAGNLAGLDANGNIVDSGKAAGDFLPKTGGTVDGDLEVAYDSAGFTVKDASGNYLQIKHETVAGDYWYLSYSVASVGSGSLRLPYDSIIPIGVFSLAERFDTRTTYALNSLCVYGDERLYRCVNPNGHTGAWVSADFAVATVEDAFAALRTALAGKADKSTTYTKTEVDAIVQALKTGSRQVVGTLPASGQPMVIYMVPKSALPQTNNVYDEYIWTAAGAWEKIGDTEIDLSGYYTKTDTDALLYAQAQDIAGKADKVANAVDGHLAGLDGNGNLTDSGFAPGDFAAASSLAAVATSGSYDDLADKPTIPAAQVQSDWDEDDTGDPSYIQNKPTALSDFTDDVGYVTDVSDKLDSVAASPAYSASQDYTYNDTVTFEGRRYMCIASISISGGDTAVDPPDDVIHWVEWTIDGSLGDKADKVPSATSGDFAGLDSGGNLTDSGYAPTDFAAASALSGKADKASNATSGNIATLDSNGNLVDGGYSPSDFALAMALVDKADKVANATSGNLAALDANGNLTDSGKKAADFAADNAVVKLTGGTMSGNLKFVGEGGQYIGVEVEYHGADDVSTVYAGDSISRTIGSSSSSLYLYSFPNETGTLALTSDIPSPSSTTPSMDGTAAVGVSDDYARADHVHPSDTSKADAATTLAGYGITDAHITNGVVTLGANSITPLTSHQEMRYPFAATIEPTAGTAAPTGTLTDRAGNKVVCTEATGQTGDNAKLTLTLPPAVPGYVRDFLVKIDRTTSGCYSVDFVPYGDESVSYETADGSMPEVPDGAVTWLSFTESESGGVFAVRAMPLVAVTGGS